MPWFMCEYLAFPDDKVLRNCSIDNYSSFIFAKNRAHADALAIKRNMGEKVICRWVRRGRVSPYELPSAQLLKRSLTPTRKFNIIHGVCFMGYILLRSKRADAAHVLGDEGVLHQVIHGMQFGYPYRHELADRVRHYERLTPGYWRPR